MTCNCQLANPVERYAEGAPEGRAARLDPRVSHSLRLLDTLSETLGADMGDAIAAGAAGIGRLGGRFRALGSGAEAAHASRPGDIIIARGLFPESDPRIDIVGFDPALSGVELAETLGDAAEVRIYRPSGEAAPVAAGGLATAGAALGIASQVKGMFSPLDTLNKLADLRIKAEKIKEIGRQDSNRNPWLLSEQMKLSVAPRARTGMVNDTEWTFSITGQSPGVVKWTNTEFKADFRVLVRHDCVNIISASLYTETDEAVTSVMPYTMKVEAKVANDRPISGQLPPTASWLLKVVWNPDQIRDYAGSILGGSDKKETLMTFVDVGADGSVKIRGRRSKGLITISSPRRVGRSWSGECRQYYQSLRDRSGGPSDPYVNLDAPSGRPGGGSGGGGMEPHPTHGRNIYFSSGLSTAQGPAITDVRQWWENLPGALRTQIQAGKVVDVIGHGDYTGSAGANLRLSQRRADFIAKLVRQVAGSGVSIRAVGKGYYAAQRASGGRKRSDPKWRKVVITIG